MANTERERRAAKRRETWTITVAPVAETTVATGGSTAEDRLASMWQLALDAWAMRGEPLPVYTRAEMPGRVRRRRDVGPR